MKLFFRLGNNPNLSWEEIKSHLNMSGVGFEIIHVDERVAILEYDNRDIHSHEIIDKLGGTIKIGKIFDKIESLENLEQSIIKHLNEYNEKVFFGISVVGPIKYFKNNKDIQRFGLQIKKELELSARFVTSKQMELSSVIVKNEKLLTRGGDFNVINIDSDIYLGVTTDVQDFKAFDKRDYGRPAVDAKSGMLPPKLALMMSNIAGIKDKDAVILDPFCGSGTMIQELLLLGYSNVIGSDISEKAIDNTKTNLEWLEKEFDVSIDNVELYNVDAKEIAQYIDEVDAIITEPYLGPPLKGGESFGAMKKIKEELEILYMRAFKTFSKVVKSRGVVVIVVPAFNIQKGILYLDIENKLKSYGFIFQTGQKNLSNHRFRSTLMYYRDGQKVYREIMVFRKK